MEDVLCDLPPTHRTRCCCLSVSWEPGSASGSCFNTALVRAMWSETAMSNPDSQTLHLRGNGCAFWLERLGSRETQLRASSCLFAFFTCWRVFNSSPQHKRDNVSLKTVACAAWPNLSDTGLASVQQCCSYLYKVCVPVAFGSSQGCATLPALRYCST